jgi:response regulator RpfG family c-di-GMP phosphodiesterase
MLEQQSAETPPIPSILFVDDDQNVLESMQRQFRKKYGIQTAMGPQAGLRVFKKDGPFSVVVSDLQMPGMNGIQFLAAVRNQAPETVRIMLTGQGDLSAAVAAVNQGAIFRFLVKPCAPAVLDKVIEAGLDQYRLLNAEKQLTQETLLGSVNLLVEILGLLQPMAFGKANRVRRYVREILKGITTGESWHGPSASWEFEAAALLSQIGWATLPPDLLEKVAHGDAGATLSPAFISHAAAAAKMIGRIPRLDTVAQIIANQNTPYSASPEGDVSTAVLGAHLLKGALDFDQLRQRGVPHDEAISRMRSRPGLYNHLVLDALSTIEAAESGDELVDILFRDLAPGMTLEEDVVGTNKLCVLGKGQEITETSLARLSGFASVVPPDRICKVRVRKC